ncbi:MAG: heparinase II/III family protein [Alphaproteobacteria bacterium]|nr:heparinase II/III family protein [Alphaproteobacteria bacterium]
MLAEAQKHVSFLGQIKTLKQQASHVVCRTPFYHWLLSSGEFPDRLNVRLSDPWAGNADYGRLMVGGVLRTHGSSLAMDQNFWSTSEVSDQWRPFVHGFSWLRDLRAAGGDSSRKLARQMVDYWLTHYDRWDAKLWNADVMGQRIAMWLSFFDFFCGSADEDFQTRYYCSLNRQARHLSRSFPAGLSGLPLLRAARGLIYAGLSFPGRDAWILQGFETVLKEIPKQVTGEGLHVSGSPENLLECARLLLDLRYALNRADLPVPKILQSAIERMGPALRFFCYPDRKLGLHHGGQEGEIHEIDSVLSQIRGSKRPMKGSSLGRFERVMIGRAFLMMDNSSCPVSPYDTFWHSSPLSFEFMYGRDRIFTHCGGHPTHDDWQQILRHTAAHNALVLDGRPVHSMRPDRTIDGHFADIVCERTENKQACLLDASHDGYLASHGVTHRRRLFLTDSGHDFRGEDSLTSVVERDGGYKVALRFHLHPKVQVSGVHDEQDVVLTLPSGSSWRFYGVGAKLSIEDSLYLGSGLKPQKTRQLVLTTQMTGGEIVVKWALQRE